MKCTNCSTRIRPVIAVDIDGTLGNYHGHFTDFAEQYLGKPLPRDFGGDVEFNEALGIDKTTYRQIKLAYRQGAQKRSMPMFDGADAFMHRLTDDDVEVWIATTRPYLRLDNVDPDTREWLRRYSIDPDGIVYDDDKYEQLIAMVEPERIVAVVEDLWEQCAMAQSFGLEAWQPIRDHNRNTRWGNGDHTFSKFESLSVVMEAQVEAWRRTHDHA